MPNVKQRNRAFMLESAPIAASGRAGDTNPARPLVSVIVLNYNGAPWLQRCIASLAAQDLHARTQIIAADNLSTDGSDRLAEELIKEIPNARFIQHGANLGFCEGNNRAAAEAQGEYLLFLNNDAWVETNSISALVEAVRQSGADAASPLVLNYDDDTFQSSGAGGFDIFGLPAARRYINHRTDVFMPEGCAFFVRREAFEKVGRFDPAFFMYADEYDLAWRLWISGARIIAVPEAKIHHRGAANVNPQGGGKVVEFRTSDTKRYYANRNCLLAVLKNARNLLLLAVPLQLLLLSAEAIVLLLLVRRWSFIQRAFIQALIDCWNLRPHIHAERRRIASYRRRSDLDLLRFLTWRFNRLDDLARLLRHGPPKVST